MIKVAVGKRGAVSRGTQRERDIGRERKRMEYYIVLCNSLCFVDIIVRITQ